MTFHQRSPITTTTDKPRDNCLIIDLFVPPLIRGTVVVQTVVRTRVTVVAWMLYHFWIALKANIRSLFVPVVQIVNNKKKNNNKI